MPVDTSTLRKYAFLCGADGGSASGMLSVYAKEASEDICVYSARRSFAGAASSSSGRGCRRGRGSA